MSFLDILDIFSNVSQIGDKEPGAKRPKIYVLFTILLVPGIFWFAIEVQSIVQLPSPFLFLALSITGGLILTIGVIILLYQLALIETLRLRDFFTILIPVTLLTISFVSYAMR
ncbi:MAG: hypothetical protein HYZ44_13575 [Bacteroidetes bacterium]|nr:hypothetical protein [Bacteroidota bacterium]